jgi:hypothetical protein
LQNYLGRISVGRFTPGGNFELIKGLQKYPEKITTEKSSSSNSRSEKTSGPILLQLMPLASDAT